MRRAKNPNLNFMNNLPIVESIFNIIILTLTHYFGKSQDKRLYNLALLLKTLKNILYRNLQRQKRKYKFISTGITIYNNLAIYIYILVLNLFY